MNPSQWVDISKFPEDEKPHIIHLAKAHNALNEDVDKISGASQEDKAIMHKVFSLALKGGKYLHSKRFNIMVASAQAWLVVYILKALGVDISRFGPLINKVVDAVLSQ